MYILTKIFTKLNLYYENYIIYYPKTNYKETKPYNKNSSKDTNNNNLNLNIDDSSNENNINKNNNNNAPNAPPISNSTGITEFNNNTHYINMELYPIIRNFYNINPKNVEIKSIIGDGNCLFRAISHFKKGTEFMYKDIRKEIYEEAKSRKNMLPNIFIESEKGKIRMHEYIEYINENGNYGGGFELSIAYDIYNVNIS